MGWTGRLTLDYRSEPLADGVPRTVVGDRHDGPLRVLASLWPEAPAVCHSVLVHPPGGLVGGDDLSIAIRVGEGAHALVTTPGATRYYRSTGATATQRVEAVVAAGGRLEWLPLESIAYRGAIGENRTRFTLAAGAEAIGWDLLALGLPASGQPFDRGSFVQEIAHPGRWVEYGRIDAADRRLLDGPLGLAGRPVHGCVWFAAGSGLADARRDALLDAARAAVAAEPLLAPTAGATAPDPGVVVLRVLAARVEPAMRLFAAVRAAWRATAWQLPAAPPRVWRT
jgi:urease accessory protein